MLIFNSKAVVERRGFRPKIFDDPDHSESEERYLIVGESDQGRLLIVSYTEREDSVRLISAREVTRTEREAYEEG